MFVDLWWVGREKVTKQDGETRSEGPEGWGTMAGGKQGRLYRDAGGHDGRHVPLEDEGMSETLWWRAWRDLG